MAFCPECGKEIPDGAQFCKFCGFLLTENNDATPANEPAPENKLEYEAAPVSEPVSEPAVAPANEPAASPAQAADYDFYTIKDSMLTQTGPDEPDMPEPQKKSPLKYILIAVGAVLLVAAIVLSIIFLPKLLNKDETADTEEKLTAILKDATSKDVIEFIYEDFDSDETYEAYAVVGKTENEDDKHPTFTEAEIYFVTTDEAEKIKEKVSGKVNGEIEIEDLTYVSIEIFEEGKESGLSYLYTADGDKSVEHENSGKYSEVYQKDDKIYCTNASGKEVEIDLSSKDSPVEEVTTVKVDAPEEVITENELPTKAEKPSREDSSVENTTDAEIPPVNVPDNNPADTPDNNSDATTNKPNRIEFTTRGHSMLR